MLREELEISMGIPLKAHRESGLVTKGAVPTAPGVHAESLGPETVVAQYDHSLPAAGPGKWGAVRAFWGKQVKASLLSWALLGSRENPSVSRGCSMTYRRKPLFLEQTLACPWPWESSYSNLYTALWR